MHAFGDDTRAAHDYLSKIFGRTQAFQKFDEAVDKLWPRSVESVSAKRALKKLHRALQSYKAATDACTLFTWWHGYATSWKQHRLPQRRALPRAPTITVNALPESYVVARRLLQQAAACRNRSCSGSHRVLFGELAQARSEIVYLRPRKLACKRSLLQAKQHQPPPARVNEHTAPYRKMAIQHHWK